MAKTRNPISFVATCDPDLAQAFYSEVLGLKPVEASPYALVFADGDHMLRVQIVTDFTAPSYTVHGWHVTDINHELKTLAAQGVAVLRYQNLDQDSLGIWTTPDGNKIAWFTDPSGNILSFTQFR